MTGMELAAWVLFPAAMFLAVRAAHWKRRAQDAEGKLERLRSAAVRLNEAAAKGCRLLDRAADGQSKRKKEKKNGKQRI